MSRHYLDAEHVKRVAGRLPQHIFLLFQRRLPLQQLCAYNN